MNMKTIITIVLLFMGALPAATRAATGYDFTRYQVILDREPFGAAPVVVAAEDPTAGRMADTPPPFAVNLRVCAITETEDLGIRVGVVDIASKPPKSYLMRLGEVQDGIELVDADFDREGALLKKDGLMHWMYLDGTTGSGPGGAQASAAAPQPGAERITAALAARAPADRASYAERLKKRREILDERRRSSDDRASVGPEALTKQLQEYQMELIRAGGELGPPLPLPLTKEMDDQLVSEGVLPAQE